VTDTTTNLTLCSPDATGHGLDPSPTAPTVNASLETNTTGFVDFLDARGNCVSASGGTTAPAGAVYTRRWAIQPLPTNPNNSLVLTVLVTPTAKENRRVRTADGRTRFVEDSMLVTVSHEEGAMKREHGYSLVELLVSMANHDGRHRRRSFGSSTRRSPRLRSSLKCRTCSSGCVSAPTRCSRTWSWPGAGPYQGALTGSLINYFAPILPRKTGYTNPDAYNVASASRSPSPMCRTRIRKPPCPRPCHSRRRS
jgi:hypothetical protein